MPLVPFLRPPSPSLGRNTSLRTASCAEIHTLPNNFAILRQLQLVAATSEPMVCDNCEVAGGLFRCIQVGAACLVSPKSARVVRSLDGYAACWLQCAQYLCEDCTRDHSRVRVFREHEVCRFPQQRMNRARTAMNAARFRSCRSTLWGPCRLP